jgi:hypothetical protein
MSMPAQNQPAVIRVDPLAGRDSALMELLRAAPAWIISAGIHGVLFTAFYFIIGGPQMFAAENKAEPPPEPINTKVETEKQDVVLTNVDEGIDPEVPLNYDVRRIEDVSVPGPVDPNAAVGIAGAPEGPPVNVPPPPGSGKGQGGAPEIADALDGKGLIGREILGGYRGLRAVPGGFAGRSGSTRVQMWQEGGGSPAAEAAVGQGLRWLALHQAPAGYWALDAFPTHARRDLNSTTYFNDTPVYRGQPGTGMKNDVAGAAFGVLPFLAAGITHKVTPKMRPEDAQYVKTVARAINYLCTHQGQDGDFGGGMYAHGLATIAICEAYGLSSDPALKKHAQAALNFIISAQDPAGGGWRYAPRQAGDTSVVGWQVMALKSGQMSGLNVPTVTLRAAEKFLDSCEQKFTLPDPKITSKTKEYTGYGYMGPGNPPTLTAVGLLCRQYLGTPRRNPALRTGCDYLQDRHVPNAARPNIYYEYYATQVMHHMGGEYWDFWNKGEGSYKGMRDILVGRKEMHGEQASWPPRGDGHAAAGGRIMQTALSLLTLEVYYRHLPLYTRISTKK